MDEKRAYGKQTSGSFRKRPRDQFDNGKRKKHNPNYDHGSTNKPIDTIYRILCPVKKIGSVLGKGGDIVNALRDETHAKIRVADAIPGAEERVIIIFNYQSESEKNNPGQDTENSDESELEKNMLPHCPAQDALLKIHDRIAADEILRGGVVQERTEPDDIVTARILVPKNQVGCLLGKGGNIIKQLRTDSGANIRILPPDHLPPCAMGSDELVQVSGVPSITKKALFRISTLLHQHPNKENPPLEDIIYASTQGSYRSDSSLPPPFPQGNRVWSPYYSDARDQPTISRFSRYPDEPLRYPPGSFSRNNYQEAETAEEFSIRILCATVKIGGVIGKGGTNIRQLEQQTGAHIQVEDTAPDAEERVINISCKEVPWETRSPTIEAVLQLQSRTSTNSDDGAITTRLLVPSSKVGCILGQGGDIITEMRRRTRADIRVYSKDDKPKYASANEELVQISGPTEFARDALAEIASRLRARTFRSGNSSVSPASAPAASFRGVPPFERISHRGAPSAGNADTGSTRPGHFRGYNPERFPDRGISSSSMFGPEKSVGYDYPKAYRQSYEAQYFHSSNAAGYTNNAPAESKIPYGGATSVGRADISNSEIRQVPGARVKSHDSMSGAPAHVIDGPGPSEYSRRGPGHFPPPYMPSGSQSIQPSQQSIRPY